MHFCQPRGYVCNSPTRSAVADGKAVLGSFAALGGGAKLFAPRSHLFNPFSILFQSFLKAKAHVEIPYHFRRPHGGAPSLAWAKLPAASELERLFCVPPLSRKLHTPHNISTIHFSSYFEAFLQKNET